MGYNAAQAPAEGATEAQASADDPAPDTEQEPDYLDEATTDFDVKFKWGETPVTLRELREAYDSRTAPEEIARERQQITAQREEIEKLQGQYGYFKERENPIKFMTGYLRDAHAAGVNVTELHSVLNEAIANAIETGRINPAEWEQQAVANQKQREHQTELERAKSEAQLNRSLLDVAKVIVKHPDLAVTDPKTGEPSIKPEVQKTILGHVEATYKATGKLLTIPEAVAELMQKKAFAAPPVTRRQLADEYRKKAPAKTATKKEQLSIDQAVQQFYK